ncbi:hypothetical protein [Cellulophaga sp. Z1A5H]|uniref:hypothetical protein n=2 Tax=unclassified Cellulophaga TaxID=2634405 RepID=UPI0013FDE133|nr:hypothetical protein [Cellulophaga sp. Z1A5H]
MPWIKSNINIYNALLTSILVFATEMFLVHWYYLFNNKFDIFIIVYLVKNLAVYAIIFCLSCICVYIISKINKLIKWHIIIYHLQYIIIALYIFFFDQLTEMSVYKYNKLQWLILLPIFPVFTGILISLIKSIVISKDNVIPEVDKENKFTHES